MQTLRRFSLCLLALGLAGCAAPTSAPMSSSADDGRSGVYLQDNALQCADRDGFLAVGHTFTLNSLEGAAFHSPDQGLTWVPAAIEGEASGISLGVVTLPDGSGQPQRLLTGYQTGSRLLARMGSQYALPGGPWWTSADEGLTWRRTQARLPMPTGRGFGQTVPQVFEMQHGHTLLALAQGAEHTAVLRSTDGGTQWDSIPLPQVVRLQSVVANRNGLVMAAGLGELPFFGPQEHFVVSSVNAGQSWRVAKSPLPLRLYLTPSGSALAYHLNQLKYGRTLLYSSPDSGLIWVLTADVDGAGRVISMAGDLKGRVIAITEYGHVLLSDDDGATWRHQGKAIEGDFRFPLQRQMLFFENGTALAIIGNGVIIRSTDRGNTWQPVARSLPEASGANVLCSNGSGLILAMGGWTVLRSMDWGESWVPGRFDLPGR